MTGHRPEIYEAVKGEVNDRTVERLRAVLRAAPLAHLHLIFSSEGGRALSGLRLYNTLRAHGNVSAHVPNGAQCSSAALVGFLGAAVRTAGRQAKFLWHDARFASGPSSSVPALRQWRLEHTNAAMRRIFRARTGQPLDQAGEVTLTAYAAAARGLIHRVTHD
jgi:ATP-dependent protease ClpP protease subunit